jgi:hypothetical protein
VGSINKSLTQSESTLSAELVKLGTIGLCREQPPGVRNALELMLAAALELDPGANEKVSYCARYEDFARAGQRSNASCNVNGQTANVGTAQVHLTGMNPNSDLKS